MDLQYSHFLASEANLNNAIDLAASHFPAEHQTRNIDYLRWLYLHNPAGTATLVVAMDGSNWAGMLALVPIELVHDGRCQSAAFCVNVLSHPEHRGKNIFVKLIGMSRDLLASQGTWLIGHPNSAAIPGWTRKKMQFRDTLAPSIPKLLPRNWLWRTEHLKSKESLQTIPDYVWAPQASGVHIKYSADFMAWRYLDHPCKKYELRAMRKFLDKKLTGLTVSRSFKPGIRLSVDWTHPDCRVAARVFPFSIVMTPYKKARNVGQSTWQPTAKKSMAFFVSTWTNDVPNSEFHELTLGASDF